MSRTPTRQCQSSDTCWTGRATGTGKSCTDARANGHRDGPGNPVGIRGGYELTGAIWADPCVSLQASETSMSPQTGRMRKSINPDAWNYDVAGGVHTRLQANCREPVQTVGMPLQENGRKRSARRQSVHRKRSFGRLPRLEGLSRCGRLTKGHVMHSLLAA